jgi:Tfp pilus assembly protein PilN
MAVGFGVLSLLWVFLGGVQWLSQFRELSRLRSELSELKPRTEKFDALLRKNDSSATGQARGEKVLGALCEIVRCIPQEMRLRSLSYWKGGKVVLQGDAPALAEIMSFMGRLEKSSGFSGVELTDSQAGKGGAEGRIDFEIRCNRRGGLEKNAG